MHGLKISDTYMRRFMRPRVHGIVFFVFVWLLSACRDGGGPGGETKADQQGFFNSTQIYPANSVRFAALTTTSAHHRVMPVITAHNSTLSLHCGSTYIGALDLASKSGITINTAGTCGRAVLTPAFTVSAWRHYKGDIYVANVMDKVAQVFVDGNLIMEAHYPNSVEESGWLIPASTTADSMTMRPNNLPNNDIVGARATFRSWKWQLGTRFVTSFKNGTINLSPFSIPGSAFEDTPPGNFYLEGKLWMLDSPGEWAWSHGKLYILMPDRSHPGKRVLAAPDADAVDARGSQNVTIENVLIFGGRNGVNASNTAGLKLHNLEVAYSNKAGIALSGMQGGMIDNVDVTHAIRTGIDGGWWSTNVTVKNSRVTNTNMIGMHKGSDGGIFFGDGVGASVINNIVANGGKTGIFMGKSRNAVVKRNTINGACLIHADCGGIYTFARDRQPLNTRIEDNKISNVNGHAIGSSSVERYGIYLDDSSNGVAVLGNTVSNCATGMQIHGGFNNVVANNTFSANIERHLLFSDSGLGSGMIFGNKITQNTFNGPTRAYTFYASSIADIVNFADYDKNIYQNYDAGVIGEASDLVFGKDHSTISK